MASSATVTSRASLPTNQKQTIQRLAALASQRQLSPPHPAALESRFHTRCLGGLHGEKHHPKTRYVFISGSPKWAIAVEEYVSFCHLSLSCNFFPHVVIPVSLRSPLSGRAGYQPSPAADGSI